MRVEDQMVPRDGLIETIGRCVGFFYADNGMVGSRDPDWLQHTTNVPFDFFRRYILEANVSNSRTMTYQYRVLRAGMSEEAMALKYTGVGYSYRVRLRRRIPCPECGVELTARSMAEHRLRMHGTEPVIEWSQLLVSQMVNQPQVYDVRFLR